MDHQENRKVTCQTILAATGLGGGIQLPLLPPPQPLVVDSSRKIAISTPMKCPHCNQEIGISTATLADHAFLLRSRCEKCGKEFLIVDGVPMTEEQYSANFLLNR
jgi:hypothetical protein